MQLSKLLIDRGASWSDHPGRLGGTVEFEHVKGNVTINIDEKTANEIVKLCAGGIVAASSAVANMMVADVIAATPTQTMIEGGDA